MLKARIPSMDDLSSPAALPEPDVYEREHDHWPWRALIEQVRDCIIAGAKPGAAVMDYMCGTGFLLRDVSSARPDLAVSGCDIHGPYARYAQRRHPSAAIVHDDARRFRPSQLWDVVTCTAGLHHLPFEQQAPFITKLAQECHSQTLLLLGEEAVGDHVGEAGRRRAALALNNDLAAYGLEHDWPDELIEAAIDLIKNDVFLRGEFKRDIPSWRALIGEQFEIVEERVTWEAPSGGGDILFICRRAG